MNCPACSHENPDPAKFCLECGGRLTLACHQCGIPLPPGAKFCSECGTALAGSGQSAAPSSPRNLRTKNLAPGSYTPKHLAEKILTSRSALEGERKQATRRPASASSARPTASSSR